jgi:hypothetical protein
MDDRLLLLLSIVFSVSTITYLVLGQKQRDVLFRRLRLRGRRTSAATTPPRSLSPEKKAAVSPTAPAEYMYSFPPSRRDALATAMSVMPHFEGDKRVEIDTEKTMNADMMIPFESSYTDVDDTKYTPTGFSVGEVKSLGNFPDYAELSGVPLPRPYLNFNLEQALPRPYRPLRWSYHQTMCKSHQPV